MRPSVQRLVGRATSAVARDARVRPSPSTAAYICPNCLGSGAPLRKPQEIGRRAFSTTFVKKQEHKQTSTQQSTTGAVAPQTYYDIFTETFPDGPPPSSPFTPDLKKLRREFLQLQAKAHPDVAAQDGKRRAEAISARINEAYKTIQDPLRRAQYLLSLQDIDVEDESAKLEDSALLMEVMEAREAVDEVDNEEELVSIRAENNVRMDESIRILEECFAQADLERAAQEAIRLRYWKNIEESIHGWEKGQGGGIIHH